MEIQERITLQSKQETKNLICVICCLSGEDKLKLRIKYDSQSSGRWNSGESAAYLRESQFTFHIFVKIQVWQCVPVIRCQGGDRPASLASTMSVRCNEVLNPLLTTYGCTLRLVNLLALIFCSKWQLTQRCTIRQHSRIRDCRMLSCR